MDKLLENLKWRNQYGKWDYMRVWSDVTIYALFIGIVWTVL